MPLHLASLRAECHLRYGALVPRGSKARVPRLTATGESTPQFLPDRHVSVPGEFAAGKWLRSISRMREGPPLVQDTRVWETDGAAGAGAARYLE